MAEYSIFVKCPSGHVVQLKCQKDWALTLVYYRLLRLISKAAQVSLNQFNVILFSPSIPFTILRADEFVTGFHLDGKDELFFECELEEKKACSGLEGFPLRVADKVDPMNERLETSIEFVRSILPGHSYSHPYDMEYGMRLVEELRSELLNIGNQMEQHLSEALDVATLTCDSNSSDPYEEIFAEDNGYHSDFDLKCEEGEEDFGEQDLADAFPGVQWDNQPQLCVVGTKIPLEVETETDLCDDCVQESYEPIGDWVYRFYRDAEVEHLLPEENIAVSTSSSSTSCDWPSQSTIPKKVSFKPLPKNIAFGASINDGKGTVWAPFGTLKRISTKDAATSTCTQSVSVGSGTEKVLFLTRGVQCTSTVENDKSNWEPWLANNASISKGLKEHKARTASPLRNIISSRSAEFGKRISSSFIPFPPPPPPMPSPMSKKNVRHYVPLAPIPPRQGFLGGWACYNSKTSVIGYGRWFKRPSAISVSQKPCFLSFHSRRIPTAPLPPKVGYAGNFKKAPIAPPPPRVGFAGFGRFIPVPPPPPPMNPNHRPPVAPTPPPLGYLGFGRRMQMGPLPPTPPPVGFLGGRRGKVIPPCPPPCPPVGYLGRAPTCIPKPPSPPPVGILGVRKCNVPKAPSPPPVGFLGFRYHSCNKSKPSIRFIPVPPPPPPPPSYKQLFSIPLAPPFPPVQYIPTPPIPPPVVIHPVQVMTSPFNVQIKKGAQTLHLTTLAHSLINKIMEEAIVAYTNPATNIANGIAEPDDDLVVVSYEDTSEDFELV